MKLINSLISCLLVSSAAAASIEESNETSNLRTSNKSRDLQSSTRQTDWIKGHNDRRRKYQVQYGGTFTALKWNNALKNKAATLAQKMAKNKCKYETNGDDYGMNYAKSVGIRLPTVASVMTRWESTLKDSEGKAAGWPANGAMTQILWSNSKYVGCADAYSNDNSYMCHVSICLYSKVS